MIKGKGIGKSSFTVAGLSVNTSIGKQSRDGYALWEKFLRPAFFNSIPNRTNPNVAFSLHTNWSESKGTYVLTLGFEVSETNDLPKDLSVIQIPESTYSVFTAVGLMPDAGIRKWK